MKYLLLLSTLFLFSCGQSKLSELQYSTCRLGYLKSCLVESCKKDNCIKNSKSYCSKISKFKP